MDLTSFLLMVTLEVGSISIIAIVEMRKSRHPNINKLPSYAGRVRIGTSWAGPMAQVLNTVLTL